MMYMGYKIERIDPCADGNYGNSWGVFHEVHGVDNITHKSYVKWELTFRARTLEGAKQGCRGHFGRL